MTIEVLSSNALTTEHRGTEEVEALHFLVFSVASVFLW